MLNSIVHQTGSSTRPDQTAVSPYDEANPRRLSLFVESRFGLNAHGAWAATDSTNSWGTYTRPECRLRLVARARRRVGTGILQLGRDVTLGPLPYYVGLRGLLLALPRLFVAVLREVARADTVIVRLPGAIGLLAVLACRLLRRRYAVEVVGDPVEVLRSGALGRPGLVLAPLVGWVTRHVVRHASAAMYVTQSTLQSRYPARPGAPEVGASSVRLHESAFVEKARQWLPGTPGIITVGSQEVPYKGHDILLRAIQRLRLDGIPITAAIVGDGRLHDDLVRLAHELRVDDVVTFTGAVNDRPRLLALLDEASVFVLPSRTEGLPRALVEAMARALPAVASEVGGVPELLAAEFLAPVDDDAVLAERIARLVRDPELWEAQSRRNLDVAQSYRAATLDARFGAWLNLVPRTRTGDCR